MSEPVPLVDDGTPIAYPSRIFVCMLTKSVVLKEACEFSLRGEALKHPVYVLASEVDTLLDCFARSLAKLNDLDIDEMTLVETKEIREAIQKAVEYLNGGK